MKGRKNMRLIFVRHGEPNYELDCLTEEGRRQAAAAAQRLKNESITEIYSSPQGRAFQTAQYTADLLGLPVQILEYMHEVSWGGPGIPVQGHPWTLGDMLLTESSFDFTSQSWREHPYFRENILLEYEKKISEEIDAFLQQKGFVHDGSRYLCTTEENRTIALFSHGGSGGCALAHLLSLPLPYVLSVMPYDFTSIIILNFPEQMGAYIHPRIELFNDTAHIQAKTEAPVIQKESGK